MFESFDPQELLDGFPDGVIIVSAEGTIVAANRFVHALLGFPPDALVGEPIESIVPADVADAHADHRRRFADGPEAHMLVPDRIVPARHRNGELVDVSVTLVPVGADRRLTLAVVRDVALSKGQRDGLRAEVELTTSIARGAGLESTMLVAASRVRDAVRADASWIWLNDGAGNDLRLVAGADHGRDALDGVSAEEIELALGDGDPSIVLDSVAPGGHPLDGYRTLGYGPVVAARIGHDELRGLVVCARRLGRGQFDERQRGTAEGFAAAVLVAVEIEGARQALERLAVISDLERVGRELHDTVVQRLFAIGLRLEATLQLAAPVVAVRLRETVGELNAVIAEIRHTIFGLQRDPPGLAFDEAVRSLVDDFAAPAALTTSVRVDDGLDALPSEVRHHGLSALRECLANVVRHAQATHVDVVVTAANGWLSIEVGDDGVGADLAQQDHGHGVRNLSTRAIALGGRFRLAPGDDGGTVATWAVPIATPM